MYYYLGKILLTSLIILAVTELAKKNMVLAAIIASVPLISVLSLIFIYTESKDISSVVQFSNEIIWFVLPSLTLFLLLPILIGNGFTFYSALFLSCIAHSVCLFNYEFYFCICYLYSGTCNHFIYSLCFFDKLRSQGLFSYKIK